MPRFWKLCAPVLALLAAPALAQEAAEAPPPLSADAPRVALDTSAGRIVVAVETDRAPVTANNFLRYVDRGKLDGTRFYRVVKVQDRFGFVQFGVNGEGSRILPPIAHEPTSETGLSHFDGTLSIARLDPGTARGEFLIMLGDQRPTFDADPDREYEPLGNAAFGRVVEGMDVVLAIFDAPVSPDKTVRGAFKGQVPEAAVTIRRAHRLQP